MKDEFKLIGKDGNFYIQFAGENIEITQQEAELIINDHSVALDVVISHKRKFQFNTAEDSGELM